MTTRIRVDQFCGLSTNPTWQAWLWQFNPNLYQELTAHLRTSKGCGQNRDKMVALMSQIQQIPGGQERLLDFLRSHFPQMLSGGAPEPPPPPASHDLPFHSYDPHLLLFPRRIILEHHDSAELQRQADAFVRDKARSDVAIVGQRAFIEYVPMSHASIAHQIPDKNWQIVRWRRGRQGSEKI